MTIEWEAVEEPIKLGLGNTVPPDDPAAFLGSFAEAVSTAEFWAVSSVSASSPTPV